MRIIDKLIECKSRSDEIEIYPIGDTHIGTRACAEKPLRKLVKAIKDSPKAYVIGGGDWADAVIPSDLKRFDFDTLPDWVLVGGPKDIRQNLNALLSRQCERVTEIFEPVKDKIIGGLEGNHEFQIRKRHSVNLMGAWWNTLGLINLTDEALIRIRFKRGNGSVTVILYLRHGYGAGRTPGVEPNKLQRMLDEWECADICFSGHSHTFTIIPPKPVLEIPRKAKLPEECFCRYRWAANWGCWQYSHAVGPSSYGSRACYPARPMVSCKAVIKPFVSTSVKGQKVESPHIEIRQITL
jgi:hypothetical protein